MRRKRLAHRYRRTIPTSPKYIRVGGVLYKQVRTAVSSRFEARPLDCAAGGFYGEYDEEYGNYYVFGLETGFAYSEHPTLEEAEERAEEMTRGCR